MKIFDILLFIFSIYLLIHGVGLIQNKPIDQNKITITNFEITDVADPYIKYFVRWKSKITGYCGFGQITTKEIADYVAMIGNRDEPNVYHWVVPFHTNRSKHYDREDSMYIWQNGILKEFSENEVPINIP